ncbi:hypothetical protein [Xanthomonas sp. NCPPB 2632]|uniref:hypothetical protein n=1 Tax=Xanthomonas sp. NCPPB 2632 TaxID=3240912 RepID=UPI0035114CC4
MSKKNYWIALALLIHALLFYVRVRESWLFADDFLNIQLSRQNGFSLHFLFQDVFGQVAPGYRAVQLLFDELFGPSFVWAMIIVGVLSVSCTYALIRVSQALGARPWCIVAGVILFISLPQFTHVQQWWAAAVHTIFSFAFIMWALVAATSSWKGRIASVPLLYGCALAFTAKTVCAPAIIGAVIYLRQRREGKSVAHAIAGTIKEMVPVIVLTAIYLLIVKWIGPTGYPPRPSPHELWEFVSVMVGDTTIGATFGIGRAFGLHWTSALPMIVIAATALVAIRANRDLLILWLALVAYVVIAAILIGLNRAVYIPDLAKALRYAAEGSAFLVLTLIMSISAIPLTKPAQATIVAIACIIAINVQVHSSEATAYPWAKQVKDYIGNLRRSSRDLEGRPGVYVLEDTVPNVIMLDWMGKYRLVSNFLPIYSPLEVAGPDKANYELMQDGEIVARKIQPPSATH